MYSTELVIGSGYKQGNGSESERFVDLNNEIGIISVL
jgi:hypothetical protein